MAEPVLDNQVAGLLEHLPLAVPPLKFCSLRSRVIWGRRHFAGARQQFDRQAGVTHPSGGTSTVPNRKPMATLSTPLAIQSRRLDDCPKGVELALWQGLKARTWLVGIAVFAPQIPHVRNGSDGGQTGRVEHELAQPHIQPLPGAELLGDRPGQFERDQPTGRILIRIGLLQCRVDDGNRVRQGRTRIGDGR